MVKLRGETLTASDSVKLSINFKNDLGAPVDVDPQTMPQISIKQPNGDILLYPTSAGVIREDIGLYSFVFNIPYSPQFGIYCDTWNAQILNKKIESNFNFAVLGFDNLSANNDGLAHIGDKSTNTYTQQEIININKLLRILKERLNSHGKSPVKDPYGNTIYISCSIFSDFTLESFLIAALSDFNQTPTFTSFSFDDTQFLQRFAEILIEGATTYALASKALIERGAEFNISDNGVQFSPPTISELLNSQHDSLLSHYWDKLKMIKASMKPAPIGTGYLSFLGSSPNRYRARFGALWRFFG